MTLNLDLKLLSKLIRQAEQVADGSVRLGDDLTKAEILVAMTAWDLRELIRLAARQVAKQGTPLE